MEVASSPLLGVVGVAVGTGELVAVGVAVPATTEIGPAGIS